MAIKFPPNAGLVCNNLLSVESISSFVQSAVRPVPTLPAILGAISLPIEVAPTNTTSGFFLSIKFAIEIAYPSVVKSLRRGSLM